MKTPLLLLSLLTLLALRASAAVTNLNPNITVELPSQLGVSPAITNLSQSVVIDRPLDKVISAMQTWYFSTNYDGHEAIYGTNAVPGVSYTLKIGDCAFDRYIGVFWGEMAATPITANSTRLTLLSTGPLPEDSEALKSVNRTVTRTLDRVAKFAEDK